MAVCRHGHSGFAPVLGKARAVVKISIITDIEGVTGAVWGGYALPESGELPYFTECMTAEIDTVVRTLLSEGVRNIDVHEAHAFRPGVLPKNISIGRSMDSMKGSDALFVIGQHGAAGVWNAVRAHTMNSHAIYAMRMNKMLCGELTLVSARAGAWGIPTVFVSGDYQTGLEAKRNLPAPLEFVCDEIGFSNHSAICRPFASLRGELVEKTKRALTHIGKTKPFDPGTIRLAIKMRYQGISAVLARLPFVRRKGDWLIIETKNAVEAFNAYLLIVIARDFWNFKCDPTSAVNAYKASVKS